MENLDRLITEEWIVEKFNEVLANNPELQEKNPWLKNLSVSSLQGNKLQPLQDGLADCSTEVCPIDRVAGSFCFFTLPENIRPTDTFLGIPFTFDVTFDPSNIDCESEPFCIANVGPIDTNCGPVNGNCQVEVFAVNVTGTMPYVTSYRVSNEAVCPNDISYSNICCQGTVSLDNTLCLSCNPDVFCPDLCGINAVALAFPIFNDTAGGNVVYASFTAFFLPDCD